MPDVVNWNTPAGQLLDLLAQKLPPRPSLRITVFGSAPLQMLVKADFLSADVDILGEPDIAGFVERNNLGRRESELGFQVCGPLAFRTALHWEARAVSAERHGHTFVFPHPWDILTSKISRLEEKDLEAFRMVIRGTGHPTVVEFKQHLQLAVDLYRPKFDEEAGGDMFSNTKRLWRTIFGGSIDIRREIIVPALERRRREYERGDPKLKERLRNLAGPVSKKSRAHRSRVASRTQKRKN